MDLTIPAGPDWIVVARLAVAAVAARLGSTLDEVEDVKIAVAEACITCIGSDSPPASIRITCESDHRTLRITVGDQGGEHEGLGLTIVRSLMDSVAYERTADGIVLAMTKRLGSGTQRA